VAQFYHTGLNFDDRSYAHAPLKVVSDSHRQEPLPSSASLKAYCPLPGNQLQMNTSPAWAVCWSACGILNAQMHNWTNKKTITENTYSPAYAYQSVKPEGDFHCMAGTDLLSVLESMKVRGSRRYVDYLEFCPNAQFETVDRSVKGRTITDFLRLFENNSEPYNKILAVKKALSEGMPVVTGMKCPPSFHLAKACWQPREISDHPWAGQALCVIGYDDEKFGGAFEVLNSWGSEWGDNGYTWIRYPDFAEFTKYAYEIIMMDPKDRHSMLGGEIAMRLNDLAPMAIEPTRDGMIRTTASYQTGTNFRVYVNNEGPGFVYAFGTDSSNELFPIFPISENLSPAYSNRNTAMAIPGDDSYIALSGNAGKNYLCVLYAREALDIDQIFKDLKHKEGSMLKNIYTQLEAYLPGRHNLHNSGPGIRFRAKEPASKGVLLVIEIDHVSQHW
jgi:hypothetical protein